MKITDMKTLIFTLLCLMTISQTSIAQKLFTNKVNVEQFTTTATGLDQSVTQIKTDQDAKAPASSVNRTELIKAVHMAAGGVKAMARQAESAKQISADLLTKNQMHEWEYINYLADESKGGGYYEFKTGDAQNLISYSNSLYDIKDQLKANFYRIAPGLDNADENLVLLQQFNKTYSKFAQLLESRFVEL